MCLKCEITIIDFKNSPISYPDFAASISVQIHVVVFVKQKKTMSKRKSYFLHSTIILNRQTNKLSIFQKSEYPSASGGQIGLVTLDLLGKFPCTSAFVLRAYSFLSPEPIVSLSRVLTTRLAAISLEGMH